MDKDTKVKVRNTIVGSVTINLPNLNFTREWPRKDSVVMIPFSILEEGMFDIGFSNLLQDGSLYIEDMEAKKALGLEPDDAKEPENIIVLNENKMLFLMKTASIDVFKDTLSKVSQEQVYNLAQYAIDHQINDFEKADILKQITGRDITKSILLERENKVD